MTTYHVAPLPLKTQILRAAGEVCLPLAIEFAIRPHAMSVYDFVGQGVIGVVLLYSFHQEESYDLEVDDLGIREIQNACVQRAISSTRVRYAKESGRGPFRNLTVSAHPLAWLGIGAITIPARISGYEEIKAQVLSWVEHPRGNPAPLASH
jgi:hypothetical protein